MICPHCQRETAADINDLLKLPIEPQQKVILRTLISAHPEYVTTDAICDALYSGTKDGGLRSYSPALSRLRHLLKPYGWAIPHARQGRDRQGHYRLVRAA